MKLTLFMFLFCLVSTAGDGYFVFIKGEVALMRNGAEVNITKKNNELVYGDEVTTGESSLAIIRVGKGSAFKINENSKLKVNRPSKVGEDSSVFLEAGSAFVKFLNKDGKKTMSARTKSAVMGVRGTEFFISYGTSKEDTWMCVKEGKVEVSSSQKKGVLVKEGEGVRVAKSVTDPKFLPWTKKLNWNFNPKKELKNKVSIEEAYMDPLNFDYD